MHFIYYFYLQNSNTMKKGILFTILLLFLISVICSAKGHGHLASESQKDSLPEWVYKASQLAQLYGSIRINIGFSDDGHTGVADNASRFGINARHPLLPEYKGNLDVMARAEWGASLVNRDETIRFSGDPGAEFAEAGNAVYTRLGYVGLVTDWGSFTFGKQWSVYSQVAGKTDNFLVFGGEACGQYNAGTDGGVSGTGRANRSTQYNLKIGSFKMGIQGQGRAITAEDQKMFDTFGAAIMFEKNGFFIGATYNEVRDGMEKPEPDQPIKGDEAMCGSISYQNERFVIAYSHARLIKHEKVQINDSTNYFYNGNGDELYIKYIFSPSRKWHAATGFNYLRPDKNSKAGDFDIQYVVLEVGYKFNEGSYTFISSRIDNSHNIDGTRSDPTVFAGGIRFSF